MSMKFQKIFYVLRGSERITFHPTLYMSTYFAEKVQGNNMLLLFLFVFLDESVKILFEPGVFKSSLHAKKLLFKREDY